MITQTEKNSITEGIQKKIDLIEKYEPDFLFLTKEEIGILVGQLKLKLIEFKANVEAYAIEAIIEPIPKETPPAIPPVPPATNETPPIAPPATNEAPPIAPPATNEAPPIAPPATNEAPPIAPPPYIPSLPELIIKRDSLIAASAPQAEINAIQATIDTFSVTPPPVI